MSTPWEQIKKRKSQLQEQRFARRPGASPQINSGRTWFSKRDNKQYDFLVENRTTEKQTTRSYTVKVDELKILVRDAIFHKCLPAMNIEFPFDHENWMLIRHRDFEEMIMRLNEQEAQISALVHDTTDYG